MQDELYTSLLVYIAMFVKWVGRNNLDEFILGAHNIEKGIIILKVNLGQMKINLHPILRLPTINKPSNGSKGKDSMDMEIL